jgi:hypothetical protein
MFEHVLRDNLLEIVRRQLRKMGRVGDEVGLVFLSKVDIQVARSNIVAAADIEALGPGNRVLVGVIHTVAIASTVNAIGRTRRVLD